MSCFESHAAFAASSVVAAAEDEAGEADTVEYDDAAGEAALGPQVGISCFASQAAFAASSLKGAAYGTGSTTAEAKGATLAGERPQEGASCLASHAAFAARSFIDTEERVEIQRGAELAWNARDGEKIIEKAMG